MIRACAILLSCLPLLAGGQSYLGVGADFGGLVRRGTWADTYGPTLLSGVRVEALNKKGLLLNLQGEIMFGNTVKLDPIGQLRTEVGILGDEADRARPVDVPLRSRGYRFAATVGYQGLFGQRMLGWRVLAGPAFTSHKIRIQDDATLTTSNLSTDYKRGYDRRAGGFGGYAEAGLMYTQPDRQFTVFLMGTASVFNAEPLRSTQFDTQAVTPQAGTDVGLGLKVGIATALLRPGGVREAEDIYY